MNATNIVNRINETFAARTEAALAQLTGLEGQIAQAVAAAEALAHERIQQAVCRIDALLGEALAASEQVVHVLAQNAVQGVLERLEARLAPAGFHSRPQAVETEQESAAGEAGTADETTPPVEIPAEPIEEPAVLLPAPTAVPTTEEPVAEAVPVEEPTPLPVAAHALAVVDDIGYIPAEVDDAEPDQAEPDLAEPATADDETATTDDPAGLHSKHGAGRQSRYEPCEFPSPGETYFVRKGRRWAAVRFAG